MKVVRAWTWIESAHYLGQKVFQQKKVDTWAYNVSNSHIHSRSPGTNLMFDLIIPVLAGHGKQ